MKGNLSFAERLGKIEFYYERLSRNRINYEVHEIVPEEIVKQGEESVRQYALDKIEEANNEINKWEAFEDDIRKNNIPIETEYEDGTRLEGRIVEATSRGIEVELDKPLSGKGHINFSFGAAMASKYVFTIGHKISGEGYYGARKALCWAYRDALHKSEKNLVERLNKNV